MNHLQVFSNYNWPKVFLSATSRRDFTSSRLMNLRSVVWFRSRRAERRWASWVWWIWPAASEPPRPERRANGWKKEATSTSEWTDSKYMKYMVHLSILKSTRIEINAHHTTSQSQRRRLLRNIDRKNTNLSLNVENKQWCHHVTNYSFLKLRCGGTFLLHLHFFLRLNKSLHFQMIHC